MSATEDRQLVNALRAVLGLDPLYDRERIEQQRSEYHPLLLAATPTMRGGFRWSDDGSRRASAGRSS